MKKHLPTILILLVFVAGLSILLYPTVSNWWNSFHQTRAVAAYTEKLGNIKDAEYENMLNDAREYNSKLTAQTFNRLPQTETDTKEYNELLNLTGTGMIGFIELPTLRMNLSVYHGTGDAVLSTGVGHVEGTSLPVGGESTHCVLSGHRGLPSAKLFTDLDQLVVGDVFMLHILDETLTYEVDQIHIVNPHEVGDLAIEEGKDYCTLVTCAPYGINTHRLLVRGHRVANQEEEKLIRISADAILIDRVIVAPFAAAPFLIVLLIALLLPGKKKRKVPASELWEDEE